ncbi:MAG: 16S rRNA (cytosine(1402)-N(4))-methyltransferase RsmH [Oscillospiraceae bacterium]|nr:16S rRNA (cytosine(1402)-N(4))-methyltransferase RsmH [Oscillospiraceae bacterium]
MEFSHISVLPDETVDAVCGADHVKINDGGEKWIVDGTLGGGGHSLLMLKKNPFIKVIGIDRDADALAASEKRLADFKGRVEFVNDNFGNIKNILNNLGKSGIDGAVLDLGVSSYQLDNAERGFGYMHDAPLDMRMDRTGGKSARDVVNGYDAEKLKEIFYKYGEEKWSARIAAFIEERRKIKPIETTYELSDIIKAAIPAKARKKGGHPAKRIFQAIRIEVNDELSGLEKALRDFTDVLAPGGRLCVITFHSLEDRIVKNVFKSLASGCSCPKELPVCVCGKTPVIKSITHKPILPSKEETEENSRSKSAKLRVAEKL